MKGHCAGARQKVALLQKKQTPLPMVRGIDCRAVYHTVSQGLKTDVERNSDELGKSMLIQKTFADLLRVTAGTFAFD